ncbi:hypothetical protein ACFYRC_17865 [Streptomyces sp. NPDC005279]|uniref:hypothetical protein n=1 Tax=Streptomyces sp. NPDC005279 TaxID=3364712 RepID=UPI0036B0483F
MACRRRQRRNGHHDVRRRLSGRPQSRHPHHGLATLGLPWLLGAYEYGGTLDQLMHGWLGDIRIVERALAVSDFMNA